MSVGIIRIQLQGFLILADGEISLAVPEEQSAEIITGFGVMRIEADGFLILADGGIGLAGSGK